MARFLASYARVLINLPLNEIVPNGKDIGRKDSLNEI